MKSKYGSVGFINNPTKSHFINMIIISSSIISITQIEIF